MRQGEAFITTRQEKETESIGALLGKYLQQPLVVALYGELGSGKTVLVRGAASGLGVTGPVSSPTFVLLKSYPGRLSLHHFDFYRLEDPEELYDLGFDEYLPGDGIAFVEWAGRLPRQLPPERLDITIERLDDHAGEGRRLWFRPHGAVASMVTETLLEGISWRVDGTLNTIPFLAEEESGRLG
ncbi:MAG: tRNA (adenosine(37)-N6)-threonylcarbamoyltransferase complex ATPase subunit type 1 TsaE [Bacillota bacterium]